MVGILWFLLLLLPGNLLIAVVGAALASALSIPICERAARALGTDDPGSVVLDEIAAIPWCFTAVVAAHTLQHGFPDAATFVHGHAWWTLPAGFALFRVFDIAKPWPVGRSQNLPGGWGIVVDDHLAAVWVALLSLPLVLR